MPQKLVLILTRQHPFPLLLSQFDHIPHLHPIIKNQPGTNYQQCPTPARMTMHTNPAPIPQTHLKQIHDPHHMLKSSTRHIFPTLVETVNAMTIEVLRNVTESDLRYYPISTIRMLPCLLKVKHCSDILLLEFLVNIELLYQPL